MPVIVVYIATYMNPNRLAIVSLTPSMFEGSSESISILLKALASPKKVPKRPSKEATNDKKLKVEEIK